MPNILIGKTIKDIKIAQDKQALKFILDDEREIIVRADGDCCSTSWVESVDILAVLPAAVTKVEDLDVAKQEYDRDRYDCLSFYGCKISTDKGDIVIDYRNESNGYYGGSLVWPDEGTFYGGVFNQNVSNEKWEDIN